MHFVAVEGFRNRTLCLLYEGINTFSEDSSLAWRQPNANGFVRVAEIVDIAPIRRRRPLLGQVFEEAPDGGGFSRSRQTSDVDVEAFFAYPKSEIQGSNLAR